MERDAPRLDAEWSVHMTTEVSRPFSQSVELNLLQSLG